MLDVVEAECDKFTLAVRVAYCQFFKQTFLGLDEFVQQSVRVSCFGDKLCWGLLTQCNVLPDADGNV